MQVPVAQLKSLLAVAGNLKEPLIGLMKTFSKEEHIDVLSGKWLYGPNEDIVDPSDEYIQSKVSMLEQ